MKEMFAGADLSGGKIEAIKHTDGGVRKLLLRLRKDGVEVEMNLVPSAAADFAVELQEVLDWLGGVD